MLENHVKSNKTLKSKNIKNKSYVKKTMKNPMLQKLKVFTLYSSLLLAVIFVGVFLSLTVLFKIQVIQVDSDTRYNKDDIISAIGIKKGENLFLSARNIDKKNIQKLMPYIDEVNIIRKIPNKVVVKVKESSPKGIIYSDSKYILIDDKARILEILDEPIDNIMIIRVNDVKSTNPSDIVEFKNDDIKAIMYKILDEIKQNNISDDITQIDMTDPLNIMIKYQDRIKIQVGSVDNLDYKFKTASLILSDEIKANERGILNVSISQDEGRSYFLPENDI